MRFLKKCFMIEGSLVCFENENNWLYWKIRPLSFVMNKEFIVDLILQSSWTIAWISFWRDLKEEEKGHVHIF